jgi:large subunit ribosomal protein L29
MDAKALRGLNERDRAEKLEGYYKESFNLRFQHASAQLENNARLRTVKKNIARLKTVMWEKNKKVKEQ